MNSSGNSRLGLTTRSDEARFSPLAFKIFFLVFILTYLSMSQMSAQWLDWTDETDTRLVLSSVANSDDEEKDFSSADLDNDGWVDVIVTRKEPFSNSTEPPKSDLLLMNINGVLTDMTTTLAPEFISNASFARDLVIQDLDGDGWKDVVIVNTFEQQPFYYANLGEDANGDWLGFEDQSAARLPTLTSDIPLICAVWAGDLTNDGDGNDDLYFVNYKVNSGGGVATDFLLVNDGNGVFTDQGAARLGNLANSAFGTAVQLHDFDGDGDVDILKNTTLYNVAPWNNRGVILLFNDGAGNFTNWQNLAPFSPYMFDVADFNGDGNLDIYVVDDGTDYLLIYNSAVVDNSVDFTRVVTGFGTNSGFGGNVHVGDFDLDGNTDVAVSDVDVDIPPCNSGRRMALYRGTATGIDDPYGTDPFDWAINSYDLAILDINNDGLQDIISGGCSGYNVYMNSNCDLVTNAADFDNDGLADACDICPTNPDVNCTEPLDFPTVEIEGHSIARQWNELLLASIRRDFARPTIHARNLFHTSVAMWDAWAAYDAEATTFLLGETVGTFTDNWTGVPAPADVEAARHEAISYACHRLLSYRFRNSPGAAELQTAYDFHMSQLGYDISIEATNYAAGSPAALGNYIAQQLIAFGLQDGANEAGDYGNTSYTPVNPSMIVDNEGNPTITDLNRWQPLTLEVFIDQSGNEIPGSTPDFLNPEWGQVTPFALVPEDRVTNQRGGFDYQVYHDPGTPPNIRLDGLGDSELYKQSFITTAIWSSHLDASDGVMWDISPNSIGDRDITNLTFADLPNFYNQIDGGTVSGGHSVNPATGQPYPVNMVPRADYARVLAEFWADGPDSETPPGHWFSILNTVADHPDLVKTFADGTDVLSDLEWDTKAYFMMGGAMHDAAVAAWGIKGWYDFIRPISAIRGMAERGQSTNFTHPTFDPAGIPLVPGYIEIIEAGDPLAGANNENVDKIKLKAWRGHDAINNVDTDVAGVDWILAGDWAPYQRPSFVTPPFAGYVSGHSTYSRAAAEILTSLTNDPYFPGGVGEFVAPADEFLVFEDGPSVDVVLQWATYQDAADESGLSRIWGGIHPYIDDVPGRQIGIDIGLDAFDKAIFYFGAVPVCEGDLNGDDLINTQDLLELVGELGCVGLECAADIDKDGDTDTTDLVNLVGLLGSVCE